MSLDLQEHYGQAENNKTNKDTCKDIGSYKQLVVGIVYPSE
jgi:hypothetical protein